MSRFIRSKWSICGRRFDPPRPPGTPPRRGSCPACPYRKLSRTEVTGSVHGFAALPLVLEAEPPGWVPTQSIGTRENHCAAVGNRSGAPENHRATYRHPSAACRNLCAAYGKCSVAHGNRCAAVGKYSAAVGNYCAAVGNHCAADGKYSAANGNPSSRSGKTVEISL